MAKAGVVENGQLIGSRDAPTQAIGCGSSPGGLLLLA
jgi:hypothetical protein